MQDHNNLLQGGFLNQEDNHHLMKNLDNELQQVVEGEEDLTNQTHQRERKFLEREKRELEYNHEQQQQQQHHYLYLPVTPKLVYQIIKEILVKCYKVWE